MVPYRLIISLFEAQRNTYIATNNNPARETNVRYLHFSTQQNTALSSFSTNTHMHAHTDTHTHVQRQTHTHTHTHAHTHTRTHLHTQTHTHTYTHTRAHTHTYIAHTHTLVCCTNICMNLLCCISRGCLYSRRVDMTSTRFSYLLFCFLLNPSLVETGVVIKFSLGKTGN